MKNKLFLLSLAVLLFSMAFVNAGSFECNTSSQVSINQGTNISIFVSGGDKVAGNATNFYGEIFMYSAGQTQNTSSTILIANITNTSSQTALNFTMPSFDGLILQDGSDYTINVNVWNGTVNTKANFAVNKTTCTSLTNRNLDRTKPSVPNSITFTNPLKDGDTITSTINRSDSNRCFVRFGGTGVVRSAMTLSGSTCTFTIGLNNPANSDYQAFVEADDGTNSTFSSLKYITVSAVASDGGGLFSGATIQVNDGQTGQSVLGGSSNPFAPKKDNTGTIIVVVIIAYLLFGKKK